MSGSSPVWPGTAAPRRPALEGALIKAVRSDDGEGVASLCSQGAEPNLLIDSQGKSLLATAVTGGRHHAVRALLEHGAHPLFPITGPLPSHDPDRWKQHLYSYSDALDAALRARAWETARDLMQCIESDRWNTPTSHWLNIITVAVLRGAPNDVLLGLEKMGRAKGWPIDRADWLGAALQTTSAGLVERVVGLLEGNCKTTESQMVHAISERLEFLPTESQLSGQLQDYKRVPQGSALTALIRAWRKVAAQSLTAEEAHHQLGRWASAAVQTGWAGVLRNVLLPAWAPTMSDQELKDLLGNLVNCRTHVRVTFETVRQAVGMTKWAKGWHEVGDNAWWAWASRLPALPVGHANVLDVGQALVVAGVPCPIRSESGHGWFASLLSANQGVWSRSGWAESAGQAFLLALGNGADSHVTDGDGRSAIELMHALPTIGPTMTALAAQLAGERLAARLMPEPSGPRNRLRF